MALTKIESAPDLTEQVYERLFEAICVGQLKPNERVTQQGLAELLNVSRQPVLQALRLLRKDGFLVDAGRRGLMVAPIDAVIIRQTYQVRSVLDGLAAKHAAKTNGRLRSDLIVAGREAAASGDVSLMISADLEFHESIYDLSGNPMIKDATQFHWQHIRRAMGAVVTQLSDMDVIWDEHELILNAINAGDDQKAESLARSHSEGAGESLAEALEHGRGVWNTQR